MAQAKIIWSHAAEIDYFGILEYYIQRNGNKKYSVQLALKIKKIINSLKKNPALGKRTDEKDSRVIIFRNYQIYYTSIENNILIQTIWDSRRNPEDFSITK